MENKNKSIRAVIIKAVNYGILQPYRWIQFDWRLHQVSKKDLFAFDMTEEEIKKSIKTQKLASLAAQYNRDVREAQEDEKGLSEAARKLLIHIKARKENILRLEKEKKEGAKKLRLEKAKQKLEEKNKEDNNQSKIIKAAKLIASFTPEQQKLFNGLNIQ